MAAPVTQVANPAPGAGTRGLTIVPADATVFSPPLTGLYVGGAGDVVVVMANDLVGAPVTLKAVPVGTYLNICVSRVMAATAATFLVGFR